MLSETAVVRFLLRNRLLRSDQVVRGGFRVVNASRRNRNFHVVTEDGPCYFVKQGLGRERRSTVAHEADMYERLHANAARPELGSLLPRYYRYEPARALLVLEGLRGLRALSAVHDPPTPSVARELGSALAKLHGTNASGDVPPCVPFVLQIPRPQMPVMVQASAAGLELLRMVQQQESLRRRVEDLGGAWRPCRLVHGDIRWDNCLTPRPWRGHGLRIVDWETAGRGDPCWDAGCVFSEFLSRWMLSAPIHKDLAPETLVSSFTYPLARIQPAIRAFWDAWSRDVSLSDAERPEPLLSAVRFAGARLVQTAYERLQKTHRLTSEAVYLVQLAENLLARPHEAAVHLLGVPL